MHALRYAIERSMVRGACALLHGESPKAQI